MPTYGDVRTKFLARLNRRDCTTALADGFLSDAIRRVQRAIELPANEASITITLSDDSYFTDGRLLIPTDFVRLKDLIYLDGAGNSHVLQRAPLDRVLYLIDYGTQGVTRYYARERDAWVLGGLPLTGEAVRIDYYAEFDAVSSASDENVLLDIAEDAVVFGALSYACDHYNDKRGPLFEQRFVQIISDLQAQADDDEDSANAAVSQSFCYPPDIYDAEYFYG